MQAEHPGSSGKEAGDERGQVGDTCKIMWAEHPERTGRQVGDKRRQVGDKCKIMRAEHPERTSCRKTSPETNVKSCGLRTHLFQRSKNPSQVNLFGEQSMFESIGIRVASLQDCKLQSYRIRMFDDSSRKARAFAMAEDLKLSVVGRKARFNMI